MTHTEGGAYLMPDLIASIQKLRESIVAILKIRLKNPEKQKKNKIIPAKYELSFCGTGFCIVSDRYVMTAYHVFNEGKIRDPKDKFYAFIVPNNDKNAYYFPIIGYPLERSDLDIAIIELGKCGTPSIALPSVTLTTEPQLDGTQVITIGFPAPIIINVSLDPYGNYQGGQFFLKSHANEGIISAKYEMGIKTIYELNVGWHHGESGGPIAIPFMPPTVFSIMQNYRNIQSPHGIMAGPHCGCDFLNIQNELTLLGIDLKKV